MSLIADVGACMRNGIKIKNEVSLVDTRYRVKGRS